MIKILVERYGMSVNVTDKDEDTPIFYASRQGNLDVIKYLESKGADLEHMDFQDRNLVYV